MRPYERKINPRSVANLHCECQGLKPKVQSNSSFLVVRSFLDVDTVNTVGSHLNSKRIPQFNFTNYLALIRRSFSARIRCQTFSVAMVERNSHFSVPAP